MKGASVPMPAKPQIWTQIGEQSGLAVPVQKNGLVDPSQLLLKAWKRSGLVTASGREGIKFLCRFLRLKADDDVAIFSTRSNQFVSSHVTCSIFDYARPSKVFSDRTKLLYVIHLFGEPHEKLDEVYELARKKKLPVIEDCAHTMYEGEHSHRIGERADFVLFSLPKAFALPVGGILLGDFGHQRASMGGMENYLGNLAHELQNVTAYLMRRQAIFRKFSDAIKSCGWKPLFEPADKIWPYAFPFEVDDEEMILKKIKRALPHVEVCPWNKRGVLSLPVHQALTDDEVDEIIEALRNVGSEAVYGK